MDKLEPDPSHDYMILKQKIIQTDMLIKKYTSKCQDYDNQSKKLEDLNKKYEKSQKDLLSMENQMKICLQELEPLRKAKLRLEKQNNLQEKLVNDLQDKLESSEATCRMFQVQLQQKDSQLHKLEDELQKVKKQLSECQTRAKTGKGSKNRRKPRAKLEVLDTKDREQQGNYPKVADTSDSELSDIFKTFGLRALGDTAISPLPPSPADSGSDSNSVDSDSESISQFATQLEAEIADSPIQASPQHVSETTDSPIWSSPRRVAPARQAQPTNIIVPDIQSSKDATDQDELINKHIWKKTSNPNLIKSSVLKDLEVSDSDSDGERENVIEPFKSITDTSNDGRVLNRKGSEQFEVTLNDDFSMISRIERDESQDEVKAKAIGGHTRQRLRHSTTKYEPPCGTVTEVKSLSESSDTDDDNAKSKGFTFRDNRLKNKCNGVEAKKEDPAYIELKHPPKVTRSASKELTLVPLKGTQGTIMEPRRKSAVKLTDDLDLTTRTSRSLSLARPVTTRRIAELTRSKSRVMAIEDLKFSENGDVRATQKLEESKQDNSVDSQTDTSNKDQDNDSKDAANDVANESQLQHLSPEEEQNNSDRESSGAVKSTFTTFKGRGRKELLKKMGHQQLVSSSDDNNDNNDGDYKLEDDTPTRVLRSRSNSGTAVKKIAVAQKRLTAKAPVKSLIDSNKQCEVETESKTVQGDDIKTEGKDANNDSLDKRHTKLRSQLSPTCNSIDTCDTRPRRRSPRAKTPIKPFLDDGKHDQHSSTNNSKEGKKTENENQIVEEAPKSTEQQDVDNVRRTRSKRRNLSESRSKVNENKDKVNNPTTEKPKEDIKVNDRDINDTMQNQKQNTQKTENGLRDKESLEENLGSRTGDSYKETSIDSVEISTTQEREACAVKKTVTIIDYVNSDKTTHGKSSSMTFAAETKTMPADVKSAIDSERGSIYIEGMVKNSACDENSECLTNETCIEDNDIKELGKDIEKKSQDDILNRSESKIEEDNAEKVPTETIVKIVDDDNKVDQKVIEDSSDVTLESGDDKQKTKVSEDIGIENIDKESSVVVCNNDIGLKLKEEKPNVTESNGELEEAPIIRADKASIMSVSPESSGLPARPSTPGSNDSNQSGSTFYSVDNQSTALSLVSSLPASPHEVIPAMSPLSSVNASTTRETPALSPVPSSPIEELRGLSPLPESPHREGAQTPTRPLSTLMALSSMTPVPAAISPLPSTPKPKKHRKKSASRDQLSPRVFRTNAPKGVLQVKAHRLSHSDGSQDEEPIIKRRAVAKVMNDVTEGNISSQAAALKILKSSTKEDDHKTSQSGKLKHVKHKDNKTLNSDLKQCTTKPESKKATSKQENVSKSKRKSQENVDTGSMQAPTMRPPTKKRRSRISEQVEKKPNKEVNGVSKAEEKPKVKVANYGVCKKIADAIIRKYARGSVMRLDEASRSLDNIPLDLVIARIAQDVLTSEVDLMPIVFTRCSRREKLNQPILAEHDLRLLHLVDRIKSKHPEVDVIDLLLDSLNAAVMKKQLGVVSILGKVAVSRLFVAVCRRQGNLERARVFLYNILVRKMAGYPSFITTIAATWPQVLICANANDSVLRVVQHVVMSSLDASKHKHAKIIKVLRTLLSWQQAKQDFLASFIADIYSQLNDQGLPPVRVFECCCALRLLVVYQPWAWAYTTVIQAQIITTLQQYIHLIRDSNTQQNMDQSKKEVELFEKLELKVTHMLKLLGHCGSLATGSEVEQMKSIVFTVSQIFGYSCIQNASYAVQLVAIETLLQLSPFHPTMVATTCSKWASQTQDIPNTIKVKINTFWDYFDKHLIYIPRPTF